MESSECSGGLDKAQYQWQVVKFFLWLVTFPCFFTDFFDIELFTFAIENLNLRFDIESFVIFSVRNFLTLGCLHLTW